LKDDRRIRKTKKAIKNAFMSLATKNEISKITVTEISDLADINRKTFYSHYDDVFAVVHDIEMEIAVKLVDFIDDYDIIALRFNPYPIFKKLTEILNDDIDFYHLLVNAPISTTIFDKVRVMLKDKFLKIFMSENIRVSSIALSFMLDFMSTGMLGAYKEWFNSDREISLEELSKHIGQMVFGGLNAIMV
jgi:AcrR family transcriptional regulator